MSNDVSELPSHVLNDDVALPALGFGTYPMRGLEAYEATASALTVGYRLIDTAVNYDNEAAVGAALRDSAVDRRDVVVQTKLPGRFHATDDAVKAGYESRWRLGLDVIDVMLIHWPNPVSGDYRAAWRGLVELREQGVVKTVGVSNFTQDHLAQVIADTGVTPAVNQVELHPYFPQQELVEFHREHGILTQAWSPLGKGQPAYEESVVVNAAERLGVTPAQVILRWHLERGVLPLPKSATASRQQENLSLSGWTLKPDEVAAITALGKADGRLFDGDPNVHEEF